MIKSYFHIWNLIQTQLERNELHQGLKYRPNNGLKYFINSLQFNLVESAHEYCEGLEFLLTHLAPHGRPLTQKQSIYQQTMTKMIQSLKKSMWNMFDGIERVRGSYKALEMERLNPNKIGKWGIVARTWTQVWFFHMLLNSHIPWFENLT